MSIEQADIVDRIGVRPDGAVEINFEPKIADGALQFRVTEQQLEGT